MGESVVQKTQQLVALAKDGDQAAIERLCGVYAERIRRIVRFRMGPQLRSQMESMDIVQDALFAGLSDLGQFEYGKNGDFMRWLSRIAENRIKDNVDRMHAAKRDVRREAPVETWSAVRSPIVTTTPSVILARKEQYDHLESAMDRIKPEYREVIILSRIENRSNREIGRKLEISPNAVSKLLARAIVAVAKEYRKT